MIAKILIGVLLFLSIHYSAFSQEVPEGFEKYKVKPGDTLFKITPEKNWDLIKKVNRIDPQHLIIGKEILIPVDLEKAKNFCPVPQTIQETDKRLVVVFLDIQYFGAYEKGNLLFWGPVCSGRDGRRTPKGKFKIIWKAKKYTSKKYAAEMPFAMNIANWGLFLHEQSLTGKPSSHGCIRLLHEDAKRLYYWTQKGDRVFIQ